MSSPFIVDFDPVALQLGPLAVHWYGLMYLGGFFGAWWLGEHRRRAGRLPVDQNRFIDLLYYAILGIVLGGRLGYMLVYYTPHSWWLSDPLALFRVWDGGMSFHGGLVGVLLAIGWWSRRSHIHYFDTVDFVAPLVPIGLFLGRIGNFINGELWGKPSHVPWAMLFPDAARDDQLFVQQHPEWLGLLEQYHLLPRHPSPLYEAALEGIVLFTVLFMLSRRPRPRYMVSGWFALLYGCFRFAVEFLRLPDAQIGYLLGNWFTMGQLLSLPLILIGLYLLWRSRTAPVFDATQTSSSS